MRVSIGQLAERLGVSVFTLRRWEKIGQLTAIRTTGGHRRYDLDLAMCQTPIKANQKYTIAYCRVSTKNKTDDLDRQKQVAELFCSSKGWNYKIIEDVGSGLNYKKSGLDKLITLIESEQIDRIVLTHKDRLLRFGAEIIFKLCELHKVEIEIINKDDEKSDFQKELVEDVLSIISVFSEKLYGQRSHKNKKIIEENKILFK
jgi:excisionase family DNA binding protein